VFIRNLWMIVYGRKCRKQSIVAQKLEQE